VFQALANLRACLKIIPAAIGCGFRWLRQRLKWVFTVARLRFQAHFYRFLALENLAQPRDEIIFKQALRVRAAPAVYHDKFCEETRQQLMRVNVVLVWMNPIQDGRRSIPDSIQKYSDHHT
jgi:hypothetical protein